MSKDKKNLPMLHIAMILHPDNPPGWQKDGHGSKVWRSCPGTADQWGIARAVEEDGRFACRLTSYQNMTGVMNSRKGFDILVLFIADRNKNCLKQEEMCWLRESRAKVICVAYGTVFLKDAFRIGVSRYVLRENMEKDLPEAVHEILQEIKPPQGLWLTVDGEEKWILFVDIYYIEAFGDEAIIYKKDGYSKVRKTMEYLSERLGKDFYRCHKSYIVNFAYILRIEGDNIVLRDARVVPVSVRRRNGLEKVFHFYEEALTFTEKPQRLT